MPFPSYVLPSRIRQISPPDFGVVTYEFEDGSSSRRLQSVLPIFSGLQVNYNGVNGQFVADLMTFYREEAEGLKNSFDLPDNFFDRHPDIILELITLISTPNQKWRFDSPPKIDSKVVDVYEVSFSLKNVS